jgi:hypothetical protein
MSKLKQVCVGQNCSSVVKKLPVLLQGIGGRVKSVKFNAALEVSIFFGGVLFKLNATREIATKAFKLQNICVNFTAEVKGTVGTLISIESNHEGV